MTEHRRHSAVLPQADNPLLALDLAEAAAGLACGALDPVALTEAYLARIAVTEPALNAYFTVDAEGARAAATLAGLEIAGGHYRGPLHGIPVGVKDLIDTAGLRTTYGSPRYASHVPTTDALVVARLRSAGAVILGKQATHEFAWGGRTDSVHFGPTHNPHDLARIPGGSSGGGAASIVARSSLLAIGSDTAGSVRIPAAFCGCVGYKPAHGWIDLAGVFPLAPSLDHVGVMARTAVDAALAARSLGDSCLAAWDSRYDAPRAQHLRVGVITGPSADLLEPEVRLGVAASIDTLRESGAEIIHVPLTRIDDRVWAVFARVRAHASAVHGAAFRAEPATYGADLAELLAMPPVSAEDLAAADAILAEVRAEVDAALGDVHVLLSATEPVLAPPIGSTHVPLCGVSTPIENALTRLTSVANATGLPAISVPAPMLGAALPVGIQLQCANSNVPAMISAGQIVMGGAVTSG